MQCSIFLAVPSVANLSAVAVIGATEELIETPMSETPDLVLIGTASWEVEDAAEHALSLLYTARFELADQTCPERDPGWVSAHSFKGAKVGCTLHWTAGKCSSHHDQPRRARA
jgi:hypothetical protein